MPQGRLIFWGQGYLLFGIAGVGQELPAEPFMQAEQAGFCAGLGAPELVPVLWGNDHLQGFPQAAI